MDKGVVSRFQMMQRNQSFTTWFELKRAVEIEFGPSMFDCPQAALFKLTQQESVGDYYLEFTALANRSQINPLEALTDYFISGLKADIKRDVIAQCPNSLIHTVLLDKLYEEKYTTTFRTPNFPSTNRQNLTHNTNSNNPRPPPKVLNHLYHHFYPLPTPNPSINQ
ncbi:hypothetical protein S245_071022 [Arachis hypogaea]|nr:Transposon Ty3-G Gag-Pol polyprotein [Arachis hypogaea]